MKFIKKTIILGTALGLSSSLLTAGDVSTTVEHSAGGFDTHRVDSHAPIGVMGEHTHEAGEWMLSYRYIFMQMDGHRDGTNSITNQGAYDLGFMAVAAEMEMEMHMIGLMYAPTDNVTLMAMLNYIRKDMRVEPRNAMMSPFNHASEGLGDVSIGALLKVYDSENHRVHLNMGMVLPTAEVDEVDRGTYMPFGMQLGSGTWDLKLGITYLGQSENYSWGAQLSGRVGLEGENGTGFSYGDSVNLTTWIARRINRSVSVSARLNYSLQDRIDGEFDRVVPRVAPQHFQENYGGEVLEAGLGVNFLFQEGILKGHRIAAEVLVPVYQNANGVGMDRSYTVTVGWQKAF